jgi:hypothetical protein
LLQALPRPTTAPADQGLKQFTDHAAELDKELIALLASAEAPAALDALDGVLPAAQDKPVGDKGIIDAMDAVISGQTEAQMTPLLRPVTDEQVAAAIAMADQNLNAFTLALDPAAKTIERIRQALNAQAELSQFFLRQVPSPSPALQAADLEIAAAQADLSAARLRFSAERYDREARYNSVSADLYEVKVRQSGIQSDRNRRRSANFFYGMLAAQAGVTVSTLSIAVHRKSVFWTLAAAAGTLAIAFSGYIYLFT